MDPYNFNPYAQPGQRLPMGRMGPQGMPPGQGGPFPPQGMPGAGAGGGGAPFGAAGPGGPAAQPTGGIQAGLQNGPAPTGPMPPAAAPAGAGELPPELVEKMLALRAGGSAITEAEKQQALADQLRSDARGALNAKRLPSSTGGMVVAPTWGAALGSLADQYRASKLDAGAKETRGKVDKARADASRELFEAMRKRNNVLGSALTASEM